jgi:hypothetical protein
MPDRQRASQGGLGIRRRSAGPIHGPSPGEGFPRAPVGRGHDRR